VSSSACPPRAPAWSGTASPRAAATPDDAAGRSWRLARNCCLAPAQLLWGTCAVPLLACAASLVFVALGYPLIALFALVQALGILAAVLAYGRHAVDKEELSLRGGQLRLTVHEGSRVASHGWCARGVRLQPALQGTEPLQLLAGGRRYALGRHLCAAHRLVLARELKQALEHERSGPPFPIDKEPS
jgi:uncharacterized membrane protein